MLTLQLFIHKTKISNEYYRTARYRTMFSATRAVVTAPGAHFAIPAKRSAMHYATFGGYVKSEHTRLDGIKKMDYHPKLVEVIEVDDHPYFPKGTCVVLGSFTKNPLTGVLKFVFYENHLLNDDFGRAQYLTCPRTQIRILDMKAFRIDPLITEAIKNHPHSTLVSKWYTEFIIKKNIIWVAHKDTNPNIYKTLLKNYEKIQLDEGL